MEVCSRLVYSWWYVECSEDVEYGFVACYGGNGIIAVCSSGVVRIFCIGQGFSQGVNQYRPKCMNTCLP